MLCANCQKICVDCQEEQVALKKKEEIIFSDWFFQCLDFCASNDIGQGGQDIWKMKPTKKWRKMYDDEIPPNMAAIKYFSK